MIAAKVTACTGALAFLAAAAGAAGTGVMALGAVLLLVAAVTGAVALEERDAVEGLVVHDLTREAPVLDEAPADALVA